MVETASRAGMAPKEKTGYLEVKLPTKLKGLKWKVWRRRWVVLQHLTVLTEDKPMLRLTFYHSENSWRQQAGKLPNRGQNRRERGQSIYLEDISGVARVRSRTQRFAFSLVSGIPGNTVVLLAGSSETDAQAWIWAIRSGGQPQEPIKDLDIGEYYHNAFVIDNDTSAQLGLTGRYLMVVSQNALSLYSPLDGRLCQEWRLNHLLRFYIKEGFPVEDTNRVLVIDAGRSCPTGSGTFSFFLDDALDVLSNIKTSIRRTLSRRKAETLPPMRRMSLPDTGSFLPPPVKTDHQTPSCGSTTAPVPDRIERTGSCGLSSRFVGRRGSLDAVDHRRQRSLPFEVDYSPLAHGECNIFQAVRRGTASSRSSAFSEDNEGCRNLRGHVVPEGQSQNLLNNNCHDECEKDHGIRGEGDVRDTRSSNRDATDQKSEEEDFDEMQDKLKEIYTHKSYSKHRTSLSPEGGDDEGSVPANYFRRPSWFSDTSADVESSSSEEYRMLLPREDNADVGVLQSRTGSMTTDRSSSASSSGLSSWLPRRLLGGTHPTERREPPSLSPLNASVPPPTSMPIPSRCMEEQGSSSENEADDEVEGDVEETQNQRQRRFSRKITTASAHLYQELPEVSSTLEHSRCKLCYKPPVTPPELPPRSEGQSPAQRQRCDSDSACSARACARRKAVDASRRRCLSDNHKSSGLCDHLDMTQSTGNITNCGSVSGVDSQPKLTVELPIDAVAEARPAAHCGRSHDVSIEDELPSRLRRTSLSFPNGSLGKDRSIYDDNSRKISTQSGLYQDIDAIVIESDHGECSCHHTTGRPSTPPDPPEPPPRNSCRRSKHRNEEYYEDLDRFRKNIYKYLGISLSQLNPPPPLPTRPVPVPVASKARQRSKYKLRGIGRKRKGTSAGGTSTSSIQTTDDSLSADVGVGIRRVSAWPFNVPTLPRKTKRGSLVSENSFYTSPEMLVPPPGSAGGDISDEEEERPCVAFQCTACGASNHLYANMSMPTASPGSYRPTSSPGFYQYGRVGLEQSTPDPFQQLVSPPAAPWWRDKAAGNNRDLAGMAERGGDNVDRGVSDLQRRVPPPSSWSSAPAGPGKENRGCGPESDIYTDMSGAQAMYMPMANLWGSSSPQEKEPLYQNWPQRNSFET